MTNYRFIVRHVGWWRGTIHKWSTSYEYNGSRAVTLQDLEDLHDAEDKVCFGGSAEGGIWEVSAYNTDTGGTALVSHSYFDPANSGAWSGYDGSAWVDTPTFTTESPLEAAMLMEWNGGLSASGKPVKFKKWIHAIPRSARAGGGGADIGATNLASLATAAAALRSPFQATGLVMASKAGRIAGAASVSPYYATHQIRRGRRRVVKRSVDSNLPAIFKILEDEGYSVTK